MKNSTPRTSHAYMRANNMHAIITAIRQGDGISRAEIQRSTGLSHGAVSQMISELIELGWVHETDLTGPKQKGRRSRAIMVNPDRGTILALLIDSTGVHGGLYDLSESLIIDSFYAINQAETNDDTQHKILDSMDVVARSLIDQAKNDILGVGIAVPGSIDSLTGVAQSASRISGWRDMDLRKHIADTLGLPAYIENDVRLLARGHQSAKLIDGNDVALSVWLGAGIGAGITIDGTIFKGHHGLAGELGHLHVGNEEDLCSCGNQGCLETVASTTAIISRAKKALSRGVSTQITEHSPNGNITIDAIAAALQNGDKLALTICHETAIAISKALAQAINLISPSKVILSGPLMAWGEPLIDEIRRHLRLYAHWEIMRGLDLQSSGPSEQYILQGATSLAADPVWSRLEEII